MYLQISNVLSLKSCSTLRVVLEQVSKVQTLGLHSVQQPGSYWDRPTAFITCGSRTHTEVRACEEIQNLLSTRPLTMLLYFVRVQGGLFGNTLAFHLSRPVFSDQGLYSQRFLFLELVLFLKFFLELSFS